MAVIALSVIPLFLACDRVEDYELTFNVLPDEGGEIVTSKNDNVQIITATPNEGYVFVEWLGDISGNVNPKEIEVTEDLNILAVFEKREYPLILNIEGNGAVDEVILREKANDYEHGTSIQLTAIAEEGWVFERWLGDISAEDNPLIYEISSETNLTAVFKKQIQGKIFTVLFNDTVGVQPTQTFLLNQESVSTNEDGTFEILLALGSYEVVIESENYQSYKDTIIIGNDTNEILLELEPIVIDYYDFSIGNVWTYKYRDYYSNPPFVDRTETNGDLVWELVRDSISTETGDSVFVIKSTFNAVRIYTLDPAPQYNDTTEISETSFNTIEIVNGKYVKYSPINVGRFSGINGYGLIGNYGFRFLLYNNEIEEFYYSNTSNLSYSPRYFPIQTHGNDIGFENNSIYSRTFRKIMKGVGLVELKGPLNDQANTQLNSRIILESFEKGY